jgi:hypothetical protein
MRIKLSTILIVGGLIWGLLTTAYFGWNMFPESTAEYVTDGMTIVFVFGGFILRKNGS